MNPESTSRRSFQHADPGCPSTPFDPEAGNDREVETVARQQMLRADFESIPQEEVPVAHLDTFRRERVA